MNLPWVFQRRNSVDVSQPGVENDGEPTGDAVGTLPLGLPVGHGDGLSLQEGGELLGQKLGCPRAGAYHHLVKRQLLLRTVIWEGHFDLAAVFVDAGHAGVDDQTAVGHEAGLDGAQALVKIAVGVFFKKSFFGKFLHFFCEVILTDFKGQYSICYLPSFIY